MIIPDEIKCNKINSIYLQKNKMFVYYYKEFLY